MMNKCYYIHDRGVNMKDIKTSYSEKKDKSRGKIVFEQFPGDVKKKNIQISLKKSKKILGLIFLVIILLVLFVGSSFLNKKLLDEKDNTNYKLVNKFEEKYANIKPDKRSVLFKNVGFDVSKEEIRSLNDKNYIASYAYRTQAKNVIDNISVYYDEDYNVYYLTANISYKVSDLNSANVSNNINSLINNFVKVNIDLKAVSKLLEEKFYYEKTSYYSLSMTCNSTLNEDYNMITIIVQK